MSDHETPKARFWHSPSPVPTLAEVVPLRRAFPAADRPDKLSKDNAQKLIRMIAADTNNIVVVAHGKKRQRQR